MCFDHFSLGKFDMTPDNSLMQLIRNPQQIDIGRGIEPFSDETLRESFSLQQGRIPEVSHLAIFFKPTSSHPN
jgi:hypothetical protein